MIAGLTDFEFGGFEFDHVGIAVKSIAEGEQVYKAMGFAEGHVEVVASEKVKVKMFELGNDSRIELLEPTTPDSVVAKFLAKRGPGIHHICLRVKDVKRSLAKMKAAGVRLINEEPFQGAHDCLVAFIHPASAGGVLIELSQPQKPRKGGLKMRGNFQAVVPMTPVVKKLLIINVTVWIVSILASFVSKEPYLMNWFGLNAYYVGQEFWIWQLFSYMFMHSANVFHVLFNMLLLWWIGAELEIYWGRKYFLFYYLTCGVGGGLIWCLGAMLYYLGTGNVAPLQTVVVGASGAIYGLLLAYGFVFGERIMHFLMLFPMKAKFFVMILAGVQIMNQLSEGFRSQEAVLAHLGGMLTGFLLIKIGPRLQELWLRRQTRAHGRKLKLVVDNDRQQGQNGPKYWN